MPQYEMPDGSTYDFGSDEEAAEAYQAWESQFASPVNDPVVEMQPKPSVSWSMLMDEPPSENWLEELANYQPGYEYGTLLPFRKSLATKESEFAAPDIVKQMAQAILAPQRAYEGTFDVESPESVQQAINLGGMLQLGPVMRNLLKNAPELPTRGLNERVDPTIPPEILNAPEPDLPAVFRSNRPNPDQVPVVKPRATPEEMPVVATPMAPEEVAGAIRTEATRAEPINLQQFDTDEAVAGLVEQTIGKMTPEQIKSAKRGTISFEQAQSMADATGYGAEFFIKNKVGTAYNAEQIQRFKNVIDTSSTELADLANKALETRAPADMLAFKKSQIIHSALINRFIGASSEAGRTLNQLKAMSKSMDNAKFLETAIQRLGSNKSVEDLALIVSKAAQDGNLKEVMAKGTEFQWSDTFFEMWKAGLLSGFKTQVKNLVSNTSTNLLSIPERTLSATIGSVRSAITGSKDKVTFKEVQGMVEGYTDMPMALRNFSAALKNEDYLLEGGGKADIFEKAITAEKFRAAGFNLPPGSNRELLVDTAGNVIRVPFRVLNATDVGYKSIAASQQLRALAYRDAVNDGLTGPEFETYVNRRINNPTKAEMEKAMDWAHYLTFTNELGKFGKSFQGMVHNHPFPHLLFPFVNTPVNLAKYFVERTPLQLMSRSTRAKIKAGGAESDMALGKMAAGTMMMWGIGEAVQEDIVSMPYSIDKAQAGIEYAAGYRPFALKTEKGYIPIDMIDPVGSMVVLSSSLVSLNKFYEHEMKDLPKKQQADKLWGYVLDTFNNTFIDKTYASGLADFLDAVGSKQGLDKWAQSMAKSTTPTIFRDIASVTDPTRYDPRTTPENPTGMPALDLLLGTGRGMGEAIQATDPFTNKEGLLFKLDMWGNAVETKTASMINPFKPSPLVDDPLTLMRLKYGIKVPRPEAESKQLGLDLTEDDQYKWKILQGVYARKFSEAAYQNPIMQEKSNDKRVQKVQAAILSKANEQAARYATSIIGVELLMRDKNKLMEEKMKQIFPKPKRPDIVE